MTEENIEECYSCDYIEFQNQPRGYGWCRKHHKRQDLESQCCMDFKVYASLRNMILKEDLSEVSK